MSFRFSANPQFSEYPSDDGNFTLASTHQDRANVGNKKKYLKNKKKEKKKKNHC
jgi:hypothetical protein